MTRGGSVFLYLAVLGGCIILLSRGSQYLAFRWRVSYRNSKYGQRIRENARKYQKIAEQRGNEARNKNEISDIVSAVHAISEELYSSNEEDTPKNKSDRFWHKLEVYGLWAAAIVGAVAIVIGTNDSAEQRQIMARQLREMQDEQRASVSFYGVKLVSFGRVQDGKLVWTVIPQLENTGNTPAVASVRFGYTVGALHPNWFYGSEKFNGIVFDPRIVVPVQFDDKLGSELDHIFCCSGIIVYFGEIKYDDGFGHQRETQYCFQLRVPAVNFERAAEVPGEAWPCPEHNCHDDKCYVKLPK